MESELEIKMEPHIQALLRAPTVQVAGAVLRLKSELARRRDAAAKSQEHVTLQPE